MHYIISRREKYKYQGLCLILIDISNYLLLKIRIFKNNKRLFDYFIIFLITFSFKRFCQVYTYLLS